MTQPTNPGSPSSPSTPVIPPVFPRNLLFGDSGSDVLLLQKTLKSLGYFPMTFTPTTYFGSLTQHALLLFQSGHQLNQSGFLDAQSQMLLDKVVSGNPSLGGGGSGLATSTTPVVPVTTPPPATGGASFTRNLGPGSTGADVTLLQETLFTDGDYPQDIVTGYYGNLTEQAVKAFQTKYGIISYGSPYTTGYGAVGPRTRRELDGL